MPWVDHWCKTIHLQLVTKQGVALWPGQPQMKKCLWIGVLCSSVLFLFAIKIEDSFKVRGRAYNLRAPYKNMNLTYTCVISLWTMSLFNGSRGFPTSLFTLFDVCLWWSKRKKPSNTPYKHYPSCLEILTNQESVTLCLLSKRELSTPVSTLLLSFWAYFLL